MTTMANKPTTEPVVEPVVESVANLTPEERIADLEAQLQDLKEANKALEDANAGLTANNDRLIAETQQTMLDNQRLVRETAQASLRLPELVVGTDAFGKPELRAVGGSNAPDEWIHYERILLAEDGGYNLDSLVNRAIEMSKRAFTIDRIGPPDRGGIPSFATLPPHPDTRGLHVAVWIE